MDILQQLTAGFPAFISHLVVALLVLASVSTSNEILDADETSVRRAHLARKPGGDSVIAHPDEITESEVLVAELPEILDE